MIEIMFDENGKAVLHEPYRTVDIETKEDFEKLQLALKEFSKPKNDWISVEDRLPEVEISVLLLHTYKTSDLSEGYSQITIGHLHQPCNHRGKPYFEWILYGADMVHPKIEVCHRAKFCCPDNKYITHWMPLPKPPKGDT